jgi:hypothetical protein
VSGLTAAHDHCVSCVARATGCRCSGSHPQFRSKAQFGRDSVLAYCPLTGRLLDPALRLLCGGGNSSTKQVVSPVLFRVDLFLAAWTCQHLTAGCASAHELHKLTEFWQLLSLQVQSLALPVVVAWMEQEFRPAPVMTLPVMTASAECSCKLRCAQASPMPLNVSCIHVRTGPAAGVSAVGRAAGLLQQSRIHSPGTWACKLPAYQCIRATCS